MLKLAFVAVGCLSCTGIGLRVPISTRRIRSSPSLERQTLLSSDDASRENLAKSKSGVNALRALVELLAKFDQRAAYNHLGVGKRFAASSPTVGRNVPVTSMRDVLRVGVIGTGCIGIEHLNNLHLVEDVQIVAISDTHRPSIEAGLACLSKLGIDQEAVAVHTEYRDLLASPDIDAVVICTPNDHHIEVLRDAVHSGKHLLVEKPLCTEIAACAEAEALADTALARARAAGRAEPVFWCAMEYRYIPTIAQMLNDANAGKIGDLKMLTIREHRFPFLQKVGDWNRFSKRTGGTLVEKCCHHFDLMRLILQAEPVRFMATGGQDVNHIDEMYDGRPSDILDNAYVMIDFDNGARALLELCMFAEASKHQEELSLVGTLGKLEAFAPSHGVRRDEESLINYRRGMRNPSFLSSWDRVDPPPPEECGELLESHVGVDARLLEAGNHCGATYEEVRAFATAALTRQAPAVTLNDGSKAVLMGLAAHRSIETGQPVLWSDMLAEFAEARKEAGAALDAKV